MNNTKPESRKRRIITSRLNNTKLHFVLFSLLCMISTHLYAALFEAGIEMHFQELKDTVLDLKCESPKRTMSKIVLTIGNLINEINKKQHQEQETHTSIRTSGSFPPEGKLTTKEVKKIIKEQLWLTHLGIKLYKAHNKSDKYQYAKYRLRLLTFMMRLSLENLDKHDKISILQYEKAIQHLSLLANIPPHKNTTLKFACFVQHHCLPSDPEDIDRLLMEATPKKFRMTEKEAPISYDWTHPVDFNPFLETFQWIIDAETLSNEATMENKTGKERAAEKKQFASTLTPKLTELFQQLGDEDQRELAAEDIKLHTTELKDLDKWAAYHDRYWKNWHTVNHNNHKLFLGDYKWASMIQSALTLFAIMTEFKIAQDLISEHQDYPFTLQLFDNMGA